MAANSGNGPDFIFGKFLPPCDKSDQKVLAALKCPKCQAPPQTCVRAENYGPGICLLLHCKGCNLVTSEKGKCSNWYYCAICKAAVSKRSIQSHFCSQKHKKKFQVSASKLGLEVHVAPPVPEVIGGTATNLHSVSALEASEHNEGYPRARSPMEDDGSSAGFADSTRTSGAADSMRTSVAGVTKTCNKMQSLEWMDALFANLPSPEESLLRDCFEDQHNMKLYFFAEQISRHGGIRYLVSRAFKRSEYLFSCIVTNEKIASEEEAKWHFLSFAQYISQSSAQRCRQSAITRILAPASTHIFQATRPLEFHELNRFYGRSNQHCLWNSLPIPAVKSIDGIAYVEPLQALWFFMAFGLAVDEFFVTPSDSDDDSSMAIDSSTVFHIPECKAARVMKKNAAQSQEFKQMISRAPETGALLVWLSDWRDGFGSNRTKQNRKSTVAWTLDQHINTKRPSEFHFQHYSHCCWIEEEHIMGQSGTPIP